VQNLSYENVFDLNEYEPVGGRHSYEWFCMKAHFDTEVKAKSEMAY